MPWLIHVALFTFKHYQKLSSASALIRDLKIKWLDLSSIFSFYVMLTKCLEKLLQGMIIYIYYMPNFQLLTENENRDSQFVGI